MAVVAAKVPAPVYVTVLFAVGVKTAVVVLVNAPPAAIDKILGDASAPVNVIPALMVNDPTNAFWFNSKCAGHWARQWAIEKTNLIEA